MSRLRVLLLLSACALHARAFTCLSTPPPTCARSHTLRYASIFRIRERLGNLFQKKPIEPIDLEYSSNSTYAVSPSVLTDDLCLLPGEPVVRIELAPQNARRIFTGIDILADVDSVWRVLTDYENLHMVVPSLIKNEVLERYPDGGAKLYQVGGANVLPGITFKASVVLDIRTHLESAPLDGSRLQDASTNESTPLKRDLFPRPYAITALPVRDITMQNVAGEGDFDHYQGVWRMQALPGCAPSGGDATRLTYAVEIRPKGFLPVALIEKRLVSDLQANLEAIRTFVESRYLALEEDGSIFERNLQSDSINDNGKITILVNEVRDLRRRVDALEAELRSKQEFVELIGEMLVRSSRREDGAARK